MPTERNGAQIRRVLSLTCVTLMLTSCESLTAIGGTDAPEPVAGAETFCAIARPITWSTRDTDQTILEVKSHNAAGRELCGWEGVE